METQTKSYAIRCSTEEQARECEKNWLTVLTSWSTIEDVYYETIKLNKELITYDEAISLGLFGEKDYTADEQMETSKKCIHWNIWDWKEGNCVHCTGEPQKVGPVKNTAIKISFIWRERHNNWIKLNIWDSIEYEWVIVNTRSIEPVKESPSEDIVELIMEEIESNPYYCWWCWWVELPTDELKKILNKHLSSK